MRRPPWEREIGDEQASPALEASFFRSARLLAMSLPGESLTVLESAYLDPNITREGRVEPVVKALIGAGLMLSPEEAPELIGYATGDHRDPFLAVAAHALALLGSPEDRQRGMAILEDLALRAGFAEAAAVLSIYVTDAAVRRRWREYAESVWKPSVRGFSANLTREIPFGSYYTAHVLSSRSG
jgi:hypothetical protein